MSMIKFALLMFSLLGLAILAFSTEKEAALMDFNYIGEIMPTPKEAVYQDEFLSIVDLPTNKKYACIILGKKAQEPEKTAAFELRDWLGKLADDLKGSLKILKETDNYRDFSVLISLGSLSASEFNRQLCKAHNIKLSADYPGKEGYIIRRVKEKGKDIVICAGSDANGTYWAVQSLKQLFRVQEDKVILRVAEIVDYPTFKVRSSNCFTAECGKYLSRYKFNSWDFNYTAHGINRWMAPDNMPVSWSIYSGAGSALLGSSPEIYHRGKRSVFLKLTDFYPEFQGKPNYMNVALIQGDSNGYSGEKAYKALPNTTYKVSFYLRGTVPRVTVEIVGWNTEEAKPGDRQNIDTTVGIIEPTNEWRKYQGTFRTKEDTKKFALKFGVSGYQSEGIELGQVLYIDDVFIGIEGKDKNIAQNPSGEQLSQKYAQQVKELCRAARARGVNLTPFVNPLYVSNWEDDGELKIQISNPKDIDALFDTFDISLRHGSRMVMLCLDDFSSRLGGPAPYYVITNPEDKKKFANLGEAHAYLVTELYRRIKQHYPDCRLFFCPAYYWLPAGGYKEEGEKYLKIIGEKIPKEVAIVWTGPVVRSIRVSKENVLKWIELTSRKPFYWDNTIYARHDPRYPYYLFDLYATDYPQDFHQYTELGIHNNGSFDELNKVGLIQAADYYWNPEAYKPEEALRKALAIVAGKDSIDLLLQFRDTYCPLIDKYSFLRTGTSPQPISEEVFAPLEKQIEEVGKIIEELNRKCKNTKLVEELSQRYQKLSEAAKSLRDKGLVKKS